MHLSQLLTDRHKVLKKNKNIIICITLSLKTNFDINFTKFVANAVLIPPDIFHGWYLSPDAIKMTKPNRL